MTQATGRSRIPWQAFYPVTDLAVSAYRIHAVQVILARLEREHEELLEVQGLTRYVE